MSISLPVKKRYLNKWICLIAARRLKLKRKVTGMTRNEIAQALFANAYCYYRLDHIKKFYMNTELLNYIQHQSDTIELQDDGVKPSESILYEMIWKLTKTL